MVVSPRGVLMNSTRWHDDVARLAIALDASWRELPLGAYSAPNSDDVERFTDHFQNTQLVSIDDSRILISLNQRS